MHGGQKTCRILCFSQKNKLKMTQNYHESRFTKIERYFVFLLNQNYGDVCSWSPLLFYPSTLSSGILPVFLLASLNLSIYQSISQVSNICPQHQPFHYCWNRQPRPFELNHRLTLNIAHATQHLPPTSTISILEFSTMPLWCLN